MAGKSLENTGSTLGINISNLNIIEKSITTITLPGNKSGTRYA